MSSEYSIHLHDKEIKGRVYPLSGTVMITVEIGPLSGLSETGFRLFIPDGRLLEVATMFRRLQLSLESLFHSPNRDCIPTEDAAEAVEPPHRWG